MRFVTQMALVMSLLFAASAQDDALAAKSRVAKEALAAGRYSQAVKLYREMAAQLPDNPGIRFNLGLALEKEGHPAAAIPELERATRAQPDFAPAWFLLGLAYQQLAQPQKAIAPLRTATLLDATNSQALLELADAELTAGQPRDAVEDFRALAAREPAMAKAWQGLCLSYLALGGRALDKLQEIAPGSGYWHALTAGARAGEQRYSEALANNREAIRLSPSLGGLHAARAEIYRQTQHPDWAAIEDERESHTAKPDCARQIAACAYLAGDWQAALDEAHKAATPENLYWASLACSKLAEQSFDRAARLPPSAEAHELLAEMNQRMGRRVEAVEEWRKALSMKPDDRRVKARLAESLVQNRQYEEAERLLNPLVAAQPDHGDWQYLLGEALLEQRRADAALPHLTASQRLQPDHLPTLEALGRAYLALGQPAKAIPLLEKARPLDTGAISFALSSAYRRLGREEEASAALARYRQLSGAAADKEPAPQDAIPAP